MSLHTGRALTASSTTPTSGLGDTRRIGNKHYMYVQLSASATTAGTIGMVVCAELSNDTIVTDDIGDTKANLAKGVLIAPLAISSYGWIQTAGRHSAVDTNGDDDIAAGATIIVSTTDGACDSVAAGTASTYKPIGYAYEDDVDSQDTVAVDLCISYAN